MRKKVRGVLPHKIFFHSWLIFRLNGNYINTQTTKGSKNETVFN